MHGQQNIIFWDYDLISVAETYRRFRGKYFLYLQGATRTLL